MSVKPKRVALAFCASTIVVLSAIFLFQEKLGLDNLRNDQAVSNASATTAASDLLQHPNQPASAASVPTSTNASSRSALAKNNHFAELIEKADSGDAAAQYQAYAELSYCRGVATTALVETQIDVAKQLGARYADEYVDYLWALHDICAVIPVDDFSQAAAHYLSLAEQANHPAAVARRLNDIADDQGFEAADDLALQILQSNDADAILRTAPYLLRRRATLPLEQLRRTPSTEVLTAAIDIWACNLNPAMCAPWSKSMYLKCFAGYAPNCDPSESYLDYQSHAVWSRDVEDEARRIARKWQSEVEEGRAPSVLRGEVR